MTFSITRPEKITERYAHLAPENVREAVSLLDGQSRSGHVNEKKRQETTPNRLNWLVATAGPEPATPAL